MRNRSESPSASAVQRYTYDDVKDATTPETGHAALLDEEIRVVLPMDNGWTKAITVAQLQAGETTPVVVEMDAATDPVLFWSGKLSRREIPLLPLQRTEIISESRIGRIIERSRRRALGSLDDASSSLFADLEKELREGSKDRRVDFYVHEESWKNKLICGDSLEVMESLLVHEKLEGQVQVIYFDPPYGKDYNSNFQQRVDSTNNDDSDTGDELLAMRTFRDTWQEGIHSYLSHLHARLYLCRELLHSSGSIFLQISIDNVHLLRTLLDEVFDSKNFVSQIVFSKTSGKGAAGLDSVYDVLLWYAKDVKKLKYRQLYAPRPESTLREQYTMVMLADGSVRRMDANELNDPRLLPPGAERFMPGDLSSQGATEEGSRPYVYKGKSYDLPPNTHWKTSNPDGLDRLAKLDRIIPIGKRLRYVRRASDFPWTPISNVWTDTVVSGFASPKLYTVQTSPKVVERCLMMASDPGDLVFDLTLGSGTTAFCAEKLGRRWIGCDSLRVAVNITRTRLLSSVFENYETVGDSPRSGFRYQQAVRRTLKSLAKDLEPEKVDLVDRPKPVPGSLRVAGPIEVLSIGRYSRQDWVGYVDEAGTLENYIKVICRLYRANASFEAGEGFIHSISESVDEKIGISVGPISGRVTSSQLVEAAQDALALGLLDVHVLGWAFEANVGETKARLEKNGRLRINLIVIRPDTLAEGLKVVNADQLFSPFALPDIEVIYESTQDGEKLARVRLTGVGVFDRKRKETKFYAAGSGYISAWYLDEDYDADCFVDCQMFFDFKKLPNLKSLVPVPIDSEEFALGDESESFLIRGYRRIAVKVVDVYGSESTIVRDLE